MTTTRTSREPGSDLERFDLAAHASELWLRARSEKALGRSLPAAHSFLAAAELWSQSADLLAGVATAESLRQRMNRAVALTEAGNMARAMDAVADVERAMAVSSLSAEERRSIESEWGEIRGSAQLAQTAFRKDWEAMRRELKGNPDLSRLSKQTVRRWMGQYPGLPDSHFMAYRVAEGKCDWRSAMDHLEDAIKLDPQNARFQALLLRLLPKIESPERIARIATDIYQRFGTISSSVCIMYATLCMDLGRDRRIDRKEAWRVAAQSLDCAIQRDAGEISLTMWGWAHILRQYCLWRLETPGVRAPYSPHTFRRGSGLCVIDLTDLAPERRQRSAAAEDEIETKMIERAPLSTLAA